MKLKIGVMGSSGNLPKSIRRSAFEIGEEIAKHDCILITGATSGLPYEAAKGAKQAKGFCCRDFSCYELGGTYESVWSAWE
jgi:predicted Rossmann-fold nucleotide-binding protein